MTEIKPCPFCGASPYIYADEYSEDGWVWLECECNARSKKFLDIEKVIAKWNAVSDAVALARKAEDVVGDS